jgi:hypothetical protein
MIYEDAEAVCLCIFFTWEAKVAVPEKIVFMKALSYNQNNE